MLWKIDGEIFYSSEQAAEYICQDNDDVCNEDIYKDMLDECYGKFNIGGYEFWASRILEELDPSSFSCDYDEYKNETEYECQKEVEHDLERMQKGDEDNFYGFDVECIEDEQEEEEEEELDEDAGDISKVIGF